MLQVGISENKNIGQRVKKICAKLKETDNIRRNVNSTSNEICVKLVLLCWFAKNWPIRCNIRTQGATIAPNLIL